jgi:glycosyltransferase involved in cell wall biosynthesis
VPTFDNEATLERVVRSVGAHVARVIVVDDGSGPLARAVASSIASQGLAHVVFRGQNGGKGAAVKTGLAEALRLGFSHAVQIDADGQHSASDVPELLDASRRDPRALVLGQPIFDGTAPRGRRIARKVSVFFCALETWSLAVGDPLCGFRVYPVAEALAAGASGDAMDFDPEIAVRLVWAGHPTIHVSTHVRYFTPSEGGRSHYRLGRDTWLISWMHTRLCCASLGRLLSWPIRRLAR